MKTPDEIKKNARTCISQPYTEPCGSCELYPKCRGDVNYNLIALLDLVNEYERRLVQVEQERDAAIHDAVQIAIQLDFPACEWCKHKPYNHVHCKECRMKNEGFEWRGVCPENTKEE